MKNLAAIIGWPAAKAPAGQLARIDEKAMRVSFDVQVLGNFVLALED